MGNSIENFNKCLSDEEFENGELLHHEIENRRRLVMLSSLTKSKEDLKNAVLDDTQLFLRTMRASIEVYDHYTNLSELLAGGMERLLVVAKEVSAENKLDSTFDSVMSSMSERVSRSSKEDV